MGASDLNLSCPAVSQILNVTLAFGVWMVLAENDAPTVDACSGSNKSEVARLTMHVFPTLVAPKRTTLASIDAIIYSKDVSTEDDRQLSWINELNISE